MLKRIEQILISLMMVIAAILGLNQCRAQNLTFRGEVVSIQKEENFPSFLIRTAAGKELYILTDETTFLHSWLDGTEAEALVRGELEQPTVQVWITSRPRCVNVDGKTCKTYLADQIILLSALEPDAYTLPDGTKLDLRRHDNRIIYHAKDCTAILTETPPLSPDRIHVDGQISLVELEVQAQQQILHWYETRGLLYDLDAEVQSAYDAYMTCENKAEFQNHLVGQEVYPSANNEELVWFNTIVTTPMNGQNVTEQHSSAAFRRNTGKYVPLEDLFSCPSDEIGNRVLDAAGAAVGALEDEKLAFQLEYIVFDAGALEVWFPADSLPDSEYASIVAVDYENLAGILHPWAIPDSVKE